MNQFERVRGLLAQVTYKPGYRIYCHRSEDLLYRICGVVVGCMGEFHSLARDGRFITIASQMMFMDDMLVRMTDRDILRHCIGRVLVNLELHEVDEWFCFAGVPVVDPHPERG